MSEHEKLKEICDKIGYEVSYRYDLCNFHKTNDIWYEEIILNVREIIFTQEFMNNLKDYCEEQDIDFKDLWMYLLDNLTHPISYLNYILIN